MKALFSAAMIALLLAVSVLSAVDAQRAAFAQITTTSPYGVMTSYVKYIYTDGTSFIYGVDKQQIPAPSLGDIVGTANTGTKDSKVLSAVEVGISAGLKTAADTITKSNIIASATVTDSDGRTQNLALSSSQPSRIIESKWQIYKATIPASIIENAIGPVKMYPFQVSNLRFFVSSSSTFTGTIAGKTGVFHTPIMIVEAPILKTANGMFPPITNQNECANGTHLQNGSCVADQPITETEPAVPVPTGKVQSTIRFLYEDGNQSVIVAANPTALNAASITSPNDPQHKPIKSIEWTLSMTLDKNQFTTSPLTLKYADSLDNSNYNAMINNVQIAKDVDNTVHKVAQSTDQGWATYQLLRVTVDSASANIEPKLTPITDANPKMDFASGTLSFFNKASSIDLIASSKTYHVSIPEQRVAIDLLSTKVVDTQGACELNGENCTPLTGGNGQVNVMTIGIAAAIFALAAGSAVAYKKMHRR